MTPPPAFTLYAWSFGTRGFLVQQRFDIFAGDVNNARFPNAATRHDPLSAPSRAMTRGRLRGQYSRKYLSKISPKVTRFCIATFLARFFAVGSTPSLAEYPRLLGAFTRLFYTGDVTDGSESFGHGFAVDTVLRDPRLLPQRRDAQSETWGGGIPENDATVGGGFRLSIVSCVNLILGMCC